MTKEDIRWKILNERLDETIKFLSSKDLPEATKKFLEQEHILVNGYPCLSTLYFLSQIAL